MTDDAERLLADLATVNPGHHTAIESLRQRARAATGFDD